MRKCYNSERDRQLKLIGSKIFNNDTGNGKFHGKEYPFILLNGNNNLFHRILDESLNYFKDNNIKWWNGNRPTGHILSSQIACVNHLMPIRKNREAVFAIAKKIDSRFVDVLPIPTDKHPGYIAFEAVSDNDYLNELNTTRGSNCTSVDALILALDENSDTWLIPIEWKYTESYSDSASNDKSTEGYISSLSKSPSKKSKGEVRMERYNCLIDKSMQLKSLECYKSSLYYFEPFYQLMRQTLWAEQMIEHKVSERIKADHFKHVHVIPSKDTDLLDKTYRISNKNMEQSWRLMINDQSKYVIIDPYDLISPIRKLCPELMEYLDNRYYGKNEDSPSI